MVTVLVSLFSFTESIRRTGLLHPHSVHSPPLLSLCLALSRSLGDGSQPARARRRRYSPPHPNLTVRDRPYRDKPLAFYVFTKDMDLAETLLANTTAGGVTVNDTLFHIGGTARYGL